MVTTFANAGFHVPVLQVEFHADDEACKGNWGLHVKTTDGLSTIHVCYTHERSLPQQIGRQVTLLHEVAHVWVDQNVTAEQLDAFMELRRLAEWDGDAAAWADLGAEQAAEILLWGLTDDAHSINAQIDDSDEAELAAAYGILTTS